MAWSKVIAATAVGEQVAAKTGGGCLRLWYASQPPNSRHQDYSSDEVRAEIQDLSLRPTRMCVTDVTVTSFASLLPRT